MQGFLLNTKEGKVTIDLMVPNIWIFMKKMISIVFTLLLAGCVGTRSTQLLTQSTKDGVYPVLDMSMEKRQLEMEPERVIAKKMPLDKYAAVKPLPIQRMKTAPAPREKYTIQVVALGYNSGFSQYMKILPKKRSMWSNDKMLNGLPWYTLLYGQYDSKDHAECVLNTLPMEIKKQGPFIRSFSAIKSSNNPSLKRLTYGQKGL